MSVQVAGQMRDGVHEFPHTPGGDPELLGRRLYVIRMISSFQTTFRKYPDLWPNGLANLFRMFEAGEVKDLVVPTLGTIKAYCVDWNKTAEARVLSGESAEFTFRENMGDLLLKASITVTYATLEGALARVRYFTERKDKSWGEKLDSLLTDLQRAANVVIGFRDQIDLSRTLIAQNIMRVTRLASEIDKTLQMAKDPVGRDLRNAIRGAAAAVVNTTKAIIDAHDIKEAVHDLWYSVISVGADLGVGGPAFDTSRGAAAVAKQYDFDRTEGPLPAGVTAGDFDTNSSAGAPRGVQAQDFDISGGSSLPGDTYVTSDWFDYLGGSTLPRGQTTAPDFDTTPATTAPRVRYYLTKTVMSVTSIAAAMYNGDASRAEDLLAMNSFADPFAVPANTLVVGPEV